MNDVRITTQAEQAPRRIGGSTMMTPDELPVACPHCAHGYGRPATHTAYVVYYRCTVCVGVWSVARPGVAQIIGPEPEPRALPHVPLPSFDL
jgi:hypothetical protein